jgi:hypothetical protein
MKSGGVIFVFNDLRREVVVRFVDIGRIVDLSLLKLSFHKKQISFNLLTHAAITRASI